MSAGVADGPYGLGAVIPVRVTFNKAVAVDTAGGTPALALNSGGTAFFSGGSGTSTLTFTYTVTAGQSNADLDYSTTSALSPGGGSIQLAGLTGGSNSANLTLASPGAAGSLGANKSIVINGIAPTVTNVTSTTANGTYGIGSVISITVSFSQSVTVTGTPSLALNT